MPVQPENLRNSTRTFGRFLAAGPIIEVVDIAFLGSKLFSAVGELKQALSQDSEIQADVEAIQAHMTILAQRLILKRAFPTSGTFGVSVDGRPFPALNPGYAAIKAKGGLLVGGQRVGPRYPVPDQRLSSLTAKSLGVIRQIGGKIVLGFEGGRQQKIAEKLQARNNFWPLSKDERRQVVELGKREAAQMARRRYSVTGGRKLQVKLSVT